MTEPNIEDLAAKVKHLESELERVWKVLRSIRDKPPTNISDIDNIMKHRYGIRLPVARR